MYALAPASLMDRLLRPPPDGLVLIDDATIIDGTGSEPRSGWSVIARGGRIEALVRSDSDAAMAARVTARRIEAGGRWVTPGLIDCHVHLTGMEGRDPFRRNIEPFPSVRMVRAARDAHRVLAAGFTTVRHLGHGDADQSYALKEAIERGIVAGPRMLTSGWAISQTGGHGNLRAWPYHLVEELRPRSAFCDGPDECRKFVRRLLGDGADCIKIYTTEGVIASPDRQIDIPNFTLAEIEAMTDEAHRRGARVAAHATGATGARNAVVGGVDTLEHGPHAPDEDLLRLMRSSGTVFVPTLSVFEWAATGGVSHGLPAWAAKRAERWLPGRRAAVAAAAAEGIPIAVGTDSGGPPRGGRNAEELVALARAGLGALGAIRAGTLDSARALGLAGEVGTIQPGLRADLVIWRRDPLSDISALLDPTAVELVVQADPGRARAAAA